MAFYGKVHLKHFSSVSFVFLGAPLYRSIFPDKFIACLRKDVKVIQPLPSTLNLQLYRGTKGIEWIISESFTTRIKRAITIILLLFPLLNCSQSWSFKAFKLIELKSCIDTIPSNFMLLSTFSVVKLKSEYLLRYFTTRVLWFVVWQYLLCSCKHVIWCF